MAEHELPDDDLYSIKVPTPEPVELTPASVASFNMVLPDLTLSLQTKPAKAVVAFIVALAGALGTGLVSGGSLSLDEIFASLFAALTASAGVYGITNKPV